MVKRVLVTGCAGYIGSVLTRYLISKHHRVTGVDSLMYGGDSLLGVLPLHRFEFVHMDVRDDRFQHLLDHTDAVVHLAAIVGEGACDTRCLLEVQMVNALRVSELSWMAVSRGLPFLLASTCSVYGQSNEEVSEDSDVDPIGIYGTTKVAAEQGTLTSGGTVLRFATVFGSSPRVRLDTIPNQFVYEAVTHRRVSIWNPHQWRPFVHILDVCEAIHHILKLPSPLFQGQILNIGGYNTTKGRLGEWIEEVLGDDNVDVNMTTTSDPSRDYRVDFSKITEYTGWSASRSIQGGIEEMVRTVRLLHDPRSRYWRNT